MSPEGETEVVLEKPKRTPRKRTPKVVLDEAVETAPLKRAPRKRVSKKAGEAEETSVEAAPRRKAPTPIAEEKSKKKSNKRQLIVIVSLLIVGVGSSAVVGVTDKGQIDIAKTIEFRNEQARASGQTNQIIPVQNTSTEPDGGLIGMGIGGPENVPPQATSTATSTDEAAATSTEPVGQAPLSNQEAEAAATAPAE